MKFAIGPGLKCDLQSLIDTRGLIQANSGGGKSWILRRLLEQTHGHVQHIVLDPEGEFSSLREKFDYVLAAKQGGDTAADPRAAKLLAHRLLELKVSAIVDLYELHAHERIRFVRLFLEALVDAPKTLWHPALIVLDEAHVFCPEKGQAESAGAVIDLATRGRKRGFCALLATQRIAKLHKDAAAELNNKLIGRTGQDIDIKRAADELGFSGREQSYQLRDLEPGEFFGFGPAISRSVTKVKVGPVETTHPKAGARRAFEAPKPTAAILELLPQLADLPAEAEQKQRTEADLKKDLAAARAQITKLERAQPVPTAAKPDVAALRQYEAGVRALAGQNEKLTQALERLMRFIVEINAKDFFKAGGDQVDQAAMQKIIDAAAQQAMEMVKSNVRAQGAALEKWRKQGERMLEEIGRLLQRDVKVSVAVRHNDPFTVSPVPAEKALRAPRAPVGTGNGDLGKGQHICLIAIAQHADGVTREQLTVLTGYKRSTRNTYLQRLGAAGMIEDRGELVVATDAGVVSLGGDFEPLPTGTQLLEHWRTKLPKGERECLEVAVAAYPETVTREAISEQTTFARSSRNTYLQRLSARKLVEFSGEAVRASALLFD